MQHSKYKHELLNDKFDFKVGTKAVMLRDARWAGPPALAPPCLSPAHRPPSEMRLN